MASNKGKSLRHVLAAHVMHGKNDSRATSAPGRRAFLDGFLTLADPDGTLPEDERLRRAEHLLRAHMAGLATRSVAMRRARMRANLKTLEQRLDAMEQRIAGGERPGRLKETR